MLKTIYGHEVKDLESAIIVSHKEAELLRQKAVEQDKIRVRYGFPPIIKQEEE